MSNYEQRDLPARGVVAFIVGTLVALFGGLVVSLFIWDQMEKSVAAAQPPDHPLAEERMVPPEPRLQVTPYAELDAHRKSAKEIDTYGWVDQGTGRVRIPIERAMKLVVEEGLPVRP
jgi:hypothetical protein